MLENVLSLNTDVFEFRLRMPKIFEAPNFTGHHLQKPPFRRPVESGAGTGTSTLVGFVLFEGARPQVPLRTLFYVAWSITEVVRYSCPDACDVCDDK